MEIDLATLILPEFEGLESISSKGRRAIEKAHLDLTKLAGNHRRIAYEYGAAFVKIRDTLIAEGKGDCCAAYCRAVSISTENFRDCIYIYESFNGHFPLLQQFPLTVQRLIARPSYRYLIEKAIERAKTGEEVTRAWFDREVGVIEQQKKMPPSDDDDLDDDEESDIRKFQGDDLDDDDDEEDSYIPPERTKEFQESLRANTLAIEDPAEARDELCKILVADAQWMKKRIATFVTERKVWGGTWYRDIEKAIDLLMAGIQELKRTEIIHTGE